MGSCALQDTILQHVIFARDRRRKKHRLKTLLFLMAVVSILIGIALSLRPDTIRLPNETLPLNFDEHTLFEGSDGSELNKNAFHGEPDYIDIEINENDDREEPGNLVEDSSATSYEDELTLQDDVELPFSVVAQLGESVTEFAEDIIIGLAQGTLNSEQSPTDQSVAGETENQSVRKARSYSYTVTKGDLLRDVLEQSGLNLSTTKALERKFPQLTDLKVGQQFQWRLDKEGELEYLHWFVSEKEEQIFERREKNRFAVRKVVKEGVWKLEVVKGTITTDFSSSLKNVGLSARQIQQLANGLQWQISTTKLRKGDKFAILVKREYINNKVTGLGNVEAIHVLSGSKSYYAIQADSGRFYSRHGETLGKGFARYPLQFTPRISSPFNPRRFHPVTRRIAPHRGVDFAVPVGTPIIAPADGVVEHVAYQAGGAGRYIKLRHGGQYTTVYMHLSKPLVRVGQSVKKGDRIALSGNTGRSTGAHLHYEFHINGNPVNPLTVKLPGTGSGMPDNERKAFLAKAKSVENKLKF